MRKIIYKIALLFIGFQASSVFACNSEVIESSNLIGFVGCISEDSARLLIIAIEEKPRDLVLQSEGGAVEAALRVAEKIQQYSLNIRIRGYCHSSCANYILPAAKHVTVEDNSAIILHGDARLAFEIFTNRNYTDPMLLLMLDGIARHEELFSQNNEKASMLHALQKIAMTETSRRVNVTFSENSYACTGMGLLPWVPSIGLMLKLGILNESVPYDDRVLPMIKFRLQDFGFGTRIHENNPMDSCQRIFR